MTILTQQPVSIDLSREAMEFIAWRLRFDAGDQARGGQVGVEVDNFVNLMHNLLERSEPEPGNLDLIGE